MNILCRLGIHTYYRSQGVVGYCLRSGCKDLKRVYHNDSGGGWTRYVEPPDGRGLPGTNEPDTCWGLADRMIRELTAKIEAAERGEYSGNIVVMKESRDKWLEYRHAHTADEKRQPL